MYDAAKMAALQLFPRMAAAMPGLKTVLLTKEDPPRSDDAVGLLLGAPGTVGLRQVHGDRIMITRSSSARTDEADGALTDAKNLCLTIRAADCQMLIVAVPERGVIGVVHAGWKGLLCKTIPACLKELETEWGIPGAQVWIGFGPSLCTACAEFTDPVRELPGIEPAFFHGRHADLRAIAEAQLHAGGVPTGQIERHPDCTRCNSELYWSYRGGDREEVLRGQTNILACVIYG